MNTDNYSPVAAEDPGSLAEMSGVATVPTERQPPRFHPFVRGQICMALALGLSQRQAELWFDLSHGTLGRLIELDPTFAAELEELRCLAMLHPLLRVQLAARKSWRAAAWLQQFLEARTGTVTADEVLGTLPLLSQKIGRVLYDEGIPKSEFRKGRGPQDDEVNR